ncbi:RNA polymerase I subunit Rpa43, putative [Paecilomyces variotii No. 5]|uniref:DNA-directed RNA polymerase subunit n=1 Tax=Byssochlamys spectabilis (strain No. 5 / NBRC 109023) TaxID=1356009 RepID=V5G232_BYSSN|nr:RNA polymerase I subunit Rpa43, putative [Paecilomyces variotii No. 5]
MSVDAMDIDSDHAPASVERERKRKHKNKDHASPAKKRKHRDADAADLISAEASPKKEKKSKDKKKKKETFSEVPEPSDSPFNLVTSTLYLPLSPISISPTHALASLLAEHLSPLLLTYYPPLKGIVLAYSNASISSRPGSNSDRDSDNPQPLTLATTANEYGVLYVYLTATFLVFRPQRGQVLEGWVNVQSEGFLGAVVYNLFSVGIERRRLPADWKWIPPGDEDGSADAEGNNKRSKSAPTSAENSGDEEDSFDPEKEHFTPVRLPLTVETQDNGPDMDAEDSAATGYFQSASGHRVRGMIRFRVRDIDVIPGADRERGFISIEGTMLSPEEEDKLVADERRGVTSYRRGDSLTMSGGVARAPSSAPSEQTAPAPQESQVDAQSATTKTKKEKKEKDKDKPKSKSKSKKKEK